MKGWVFICAAAGFLSVSLRTASAQDLGLAPDPDAPTVAASIDHAEAHVGDRLTLTVTAIARGGIAVGLPQKLELGAVELLERDDSEATGRDLGDGRRSFRFLLYIALYEVGPAEVPPLPLTYLNPRGEARTVSTAPVAVRIRGLIDDSAAAADPQPERASRSSLIEDKRVVRAVWAALLALALLLLFIFVRRKMRKQRRQTQLQTGPLVAALPPGEVAIARLAAIRSRGEFALDGYRPFAFDTAEVVRAYLGARYGFDSLELTSTELLEELTRAAPHLSAANSEVVRFLEATDLIKFAKAGGTEAEALALLDAAQVIVLSTAPHLETAADAISARVPRIDPSEVEGE